MENTLLSGLQSAEYEHSSDKAALATLRKIPLMDKLVKVYVDFLTNTYQITLAKGDYFRVTEETLPHIYRLYQLACTRLNMPNEPELYLKLSYDYNACAMGIENPVIVVHSSCVDHMSDAELLALLGHELGHIKSGHLLYYQIANNLNFLPKILGSNIVQYISAGLDYAIMDWERKAEYTADRAGLIASLDPDSAQDMLFTLMGCGNLKGKLHVNARSAVDQLADFADLQNSPLGKVLYVTQTATATHPWSVMRLDELRKWVASGEFDALTKKYGMQ